MNYHDHILLEVGVTKSGPPTSGLNVTGALQSQAEFVER